MALAGVQHLGAGSSAPSPCPLPQAMLRALHVAVELAEQTPSTKQASKWAGPALGPRALEEVRRGPLRTASLKARGPGRRPECPTNVAPPAPAACLLGAGAGPELGTHSCSAGRGGTAPGTRGRGGAGTPGCEAAGARASVSQRSQPRRPPIWGRSSGPCGPTSRRWRPA